jgi:transcriptional regulator with XRE-family HTH domain
VSEPGSHANNDTNVKGQGIRMAQGTASVVQQRRLRADLRKARDEAGYTQKQVAEELGWSLSKMIRLETGATATSPGDLRALIQLYGISDKRRIDDMLAVTRGKSPEWWDKYSEFYQSQFLHFLAYEDSASTLRQFQAHQVPGLLQIRDYARTVFEAYMETPEQIARGLDVRMRRQEILARGNGTRFEFMLDETVIRRVVGGSAVMIGQFERLIGLNTDDNPLISIRIVPYSAGVKPATKGSFVIMEFSSDEEDFVVNVEDPNNDVLIRDNPDTTSNYVEAFVELEEIALSRAETNEMLGSAIETMRSSLPD